MKSSKSKVTFYGMDLLKRDGPIGLVDTEFAKKKHEGGLGIKDVDVFNSYLLCNGYVCLSKKIAIWVGILQRKYGDLKIRFWFKDEKRSNVKEYLWWRDLIKIGKCEESNGLRFMYFIT